MESTMLESGDMVEIKTGYTASLLSDNLSITLATTKWNAMISPLRVLTQSAISGVFVR